MNIKRRISAKLKALAGCQRGNIGMMYALTLVPALLAAGVAIDYVRFNAAETQLQSALDAASLAGASVSNASETVRIKQAQDVFEANIGGGSAAPFEHKAAFKLDGGQLVSSGTMTVPMAFMRIAGIDELEATGKTVVGLAANKKAEVVLALDYSGSMSDKLDGKVKYLAMRDAAKKLVEDLGSSMKGQVKFGLVPFSHHVYTTLPRDFVVAGGSGTWAGCTQDRQYPFNTTAETPTAAMGSKWGQPQASEHSSWGCSGYVTNKLHTMDLTDNTAAVAGQLDAMRPYAWTHIAVGAEFGYHMLSPNAPFTSGASFSDTKTEKIMVLLTDGEQTEPAFGPGKLRNVAQGEKNLEAICQAAKADGITIITMAFDLPDAKTRQRLQACATDATRDFFTADDAVELAKAFDAVKNVVASQVFISR